MTISPGDKIVNLPTISGKTISVMTSAISPGDTVMVFPTRAGPIALKPASISPGDSVVLVPSISGRLIAFKSGIAELRPRANFTATPLTGKVCPPTVIAFTDTSIGTIDTWLWEFGDGATSALQNPTHVYTTIGSFNVKLTVTNAFGSDSYTRYSYISTTMYTTPEFLYDRIYTNDSIDGKFFYRFDTFFVPDIPNQLDMDANQVGTGVYMWGKRAATGPHQLQFYFKCITSDAARYVDFDLTWVGTRFTDSFGRENRLLVYSRACTDGAYSYVTQNMMTQTHYRIDTGRMGYDIFLTMVGQLESSTPYEEVSITLTNITFS